VSLVVIFNPLAGSADDVASWRRRLERRPGWAVWETEGPGDGRELARRAVAEGASTVVAAGGDGTLNEVLNGLAPTDGEGFPAVRLGVLPLGTGNDFVRSLGIPGDAEAALAVLDAGSTHRVDVARVRFADGRRRCFLNMSAGGFSAAVGEAMDADGKRRWGALSYALSAAQVLGELQPFASRLSIDGETLELPLYLLLVANARYVAGGIPAAPAARLDDGHLTVVAFPEMPPVQIAALLPRTLLGLHEEHEAVLVRRARRVEVDSRPAMPFNVDGEGCGETPLVFESLPRALEVLVGEETDQERDGRDADERDPGRRTES
jgi:diacylglycerol kinase (ATP)